MKFLALDVGAKRIGMAKGDSDTRIAVPLGYTETDGTELQKIAQKVNLEGAKLIVLGLPRSNEGNETAQTDWVRDFASRLQAELPDLPLLFQDESLTSVIAEERLKARGAPYEKGDIDAEAAAVILQDFLEKGDF